ncbi:hypothetical protein fugu_003323 [Takifugu bimaculatus]|uniref:Ig-like domain-containing protein n=1 Tax=Takifugu bimaculatus TaxID=433685 RepID=A0A4Z2BF73_9TELE|nr:hypothetical protein fugu_003323 [Takifugu bimaculatus]
MPAWRLLLILAVVGASGSKTQGLRRRDHQESGPAGFHSDDTSEWTTWFNVDHPGGRGDYEQLDAIRFYYRTRVCANPRAIEARTTEWVPVRETGEKVHADPTVGFWCLNEEQGPGPKLLQLRGPIPLPQRSGAGMSLKIHLLCLAQTAQNLVAFTTIMENLFLSTDDGVHIQGTWGLWSEWSPCPALCGQVGVQTRSRTCQSRSTPCTGPMVGRKRMQWTRVPQNRVTPPSAPPAPRGSDRVSVLSVQLKRTEKLHVLSNPESKVRREGQTAAFCCKVAGTPQPDKYQWFHNDTLLEKHSDSTLVLKDLRPEQAGEYCCRASGPSGVIKTKPAMLRVLAKDEQSCNPKPESHLIRLPHDCYQNTTDSFYYDVGKCTSRTCSGHLDNGIRCKDQATYCCGVQKMEERQLTCRGYHLPTMVVTQCGCQKCVDTKAVVYGRASAADNGSVVRATKAPSPSRFLQDTERLVLTFVDNMQKFINTTKVLPFNARGGSVYHEIKLLRKKAPVTISTAETNTLELGEVEGQEAMVRLQIPPNSFYTEKGGGFYRDVSTAAAAQSDLNFVGNEGDVLPLRTYGMFSVDFRGGETNEPLNAGEVKVFLDSAQVKMPEHVNSMKLWSLNPDTGLWEEEGSLKVEQKRRGKREERTFLIGNMEIRERRLFNLDVPENRRCYVKVRAFRSERFMPSEQVEGVVVSLINMEPAAGYSSNPRAWGRFDSVVTGPNGACLPAFCDEQRADAYSAHVMANLGGEELEAVSSSPKLNPNLIGVPQPYLDKLNYRRRAPTRPRKGNGPVYAFEKLKECEEAPFSASHFRFSRVEGDGYDYNTVPFNEDDPMSWTEDYLSWWPKPTEYRACYIKVKLSSPHELNFKCSGMLYDQERVDRTLVKVIPQGSCKREHVNPMLMEYLVNHLPLVVNNDTNEFTMLAPLDPLGHNYGIYTIALGRCFDGTSDGTSRVMKSGEGVALAFTCGDREATRQNVFQSGQGQATGGTGEGRQNRRRQRANAARGSRRRSARNHTGKAQKTATKAREN